jgi:hypothetical protein
MVLRSWAQLRALKVFQGGVEAGVSLGEALNVERRLLIRRAHLHGAHGGEHLAHTGKHLRNACGDCGRGFLRL